MVLKTVFLLVVSFPFFCKASHNQDFSCDVTAVYEVAKQFSEFKLNTNSKIIYKNDESLTVGSKRFERFDITTYSVKPSLPFIREFSIGINDGVERVFIFKLKDSKNGYYSGSLQYDTFLVAEVSCVI